jgi:hypothetical protein
MRGITTKEMLSLRMYHILADYPQHDKGALDSVWVEAALYFGSMQADWLKNDAILDARLLNNAEQA